MKAAVLHAPGSPPRIEEVSLAAPRSEEVRVRVAACGLCRSDVQVMNGATPHPMPVVCGHEASGTIEETGPGVDGLRRGDRVVLSWAPSCGACFFCLQGLPAQCDAWHAAIWRGTMRDGTTRLTLSGRPVHHYAALAAFAEAAVVPASCCLPIPSDLPLEAAALLGCAVATGVGAVLRRARVQEGARVAVLGCGGVGLNVIQGAVIAGASMIVAVDLTEARLEAALRFGATHAVRAGAADPAEAVRSLTGGRGADHVFEAAGSIDAVAQAIEAARRGGTVVLVGLPPAGRDLALAAGAFARSDKVLMGAYYGGCDPARDVPYLIELHRAGRLKLQELVGRRRPLEDLEAAAADLTGGTPLRTLLVP